MSAFEKAVGRRDAILGGLLALGGLSVGFDTARQPGSAILGSMAERGDEAETAGLVAAHTNFGFRLFSRLAARDGGSNVFISPLSVSIALAMAYEGARRATARAMATSLGLDGMTRTQVNTATAALRARLTRPDPRTHVVVADAMWYQAGLALVPAYEQALRRYYSAEVAAVDFASPTAPRAINEWVNRQTQGMIPSLVKHLDAATLLYLANAIYFKGLWSQPFDPARTRERPFILPNGAHKPVPMMTQSGSYRYHQDKALQMIELPYGAGTIAMYVLLPASGTSLRGLWKDLNTHTWRERLAALMMASGTIQFPRFSVTYGADLRGALAAEGMGLAFTPGADFSGMVQDERAHIDTVVHKAVMRVDEKGTTAAGATGVGVTATAVRRPFTMTVDRPFLCVIGDKKSGAILFVGAIVDPTAAV